MTQESIVGTVGAKPTAELEAPFFKGSVVLGREKDRLTLTYFDPSRMQVSAMRNPSPKEKLLALAAKQNVAAVTAASIGLPVDATLDGEKVVIIGMKMSEFDDRMIVLTCL